MIIAEIPPAQLNLVTNRGESRLYVWFEKADWRFKRGILPGGALAVITAIKAEIPQSDRVYVDGVWVIFNAERYRERLDTLKHYYLTATN